MKIKAGDRFKHKSDVYCTIFVAARVEKTTGDLNYGVVLHYLQTGDRRNTAFLPLDNFDKHFDIVEKVGEQ